MDFCTQEYDGDDELWFGELEFVDQCLIWAEATKQNPATEDQNFVKGQLEWDKPRIHFDDSGMAMLALLQEKFDCFLDVLIVLFRNDLMVG